MTVAIDLIIPAYGDAAGLTTTILSAVGQRFSQDTMLRVIVFDDCSPVLLNKKIPVALMERITVVRGKKNMGRSAARNAGASLGTAPIIGFLDSDCVYSSDGVLKEHIEALIKGYDVSIGPVFVRGEGFWERYQSEVAARRAAAALKGDYRVLTTANIVLKRKVFNAIGGFDARYQRYGFEDRDLICRLAKSGARILWNKRAKAWHEDTLSLVDFSRKMFEAARYSAPLFFKANPEEYKVLPYQRFDTRFRGGLRLRKTIKRLEAVLQPLALWGDAMIAREVVPYALKKITVKAVAAISYAVGSAQDQCNRESTDAALSSQASQEG